MVSLFSPFFFFPFAGQLLLPLPIPPLSPLSAPIGYLSAGYIIITPGLWSVSPSPPLIIAQINLMDLHVVMGLVCTTLLHSRVV